MRDLAGLQVSVCEREQNISQIRQPKHFSG